METYQNVNGNSGIAGYKIGDTCIEVEFADTESVYRYSYESAGHLPVRRTHTVTGKGPHSGQENRCPAGALRGCNKSSASGKYPAAAGCAWCRRVHPARPSPLLSALLPVSPSRLPPAVFCFIVPSFLPGGKMQIKYTSPLCKESGSSFPGRHSPRS